MPAPDSQIEFVRRAAVGFLQALFRRETNFAFDTNPAASKVVIIGTFPEAAKGTTTKPVLSVDIGGIVTIARSVGNLLSPDDTKTGAIHGQQIRGVIKVTAVSSAGGEVSYLGDRTRWLFLGFGTALQAAARVQFIGPPMLSDEMDAARLFAGDFAKSKRARVFAQTFFMWESAIVRPTSGGDFPGTVDEVRYMIERELESTDGD